MERAPGVVIAGRYRLVEKLGSGGMGAVWLAHDLSLDSTCAVKIIDPEKSRSEEVRKRFVREAKAAAQLRGPHVVDVFDRGEYEGVLYIAMEHLEGEDLCSRLGRVGKLDAQTTYRVVAHVARALSSAHALGIVHRDLKPENIFLVPSYDEEIAKVLDFGIAQHEAYRLEDRATREGSFLGTPYYVSPEQARGKPTDHRSDLWSLGVITYQCLTGCTPFESDSLGELMGLILYEPIPKITETSPELPVEMEAFWSRAIERDRELRFQSAREFADQLGRALGIKTVVTVPTLIPRRQTSVPDDGDNRLSLSASRSVRTQHQLKDLTPVDAAIERPSADALTLQGGEQLGITDQAVTRSRPTVSSLMQGLTSGWEYVKGFPKRPLVALATMIGIILGGGITLYISRSVQRSKTTHIIPDRAFAAPPPSIVQTVYVQVPVPTVPSTAPDVVPVRALPSATPEAKPPEPPVRRPPAASGGGVRRSRSGTPDYGI